MKLVTSLASVDGTVILTPDLSVCGFGAKIGSAPNADTVFDAKILEKRKDTDSRPLDLSGLGMRHTSVLRYCKADPAAIGVIVSQDGNVRVATTLMERLFLWDNVQLLWQLNYTPRVARRIVDYNEKRNQAAPHFVKRLGFTPVPKTFDDLMKHAP